jgi:hypothetical protein
LEIAMTEHSESANRPANDARPNWEWLQARIPAGRTEQLGQWLANELASLEGLFAELVTVDSEKRAALGQLKRDRSSAE